MTIEEDLTEAKRFRILKERASDPFDQHLFAQMERRYRALAECDALLKDASKPTTLIAVSTWLLRADLRRRFPFGCPQLPWPASIPEGAPCSRVP
jgi:hypothetical protein